MGQQQQPDGRMHHHEVPLSIPRTDSQLAGERFKVRKVYGCPVHGMGGLMIASQMSVHLEEHDETKHLPPFMKHYCCTTWEEMQRI